MKKVYMVQVGVTDAWPDECWTTTLCVCSGKEKAETAVGEITEVINEKLDYDEYFAEKFDLMRKRLAEVYKKYAPDETRRFDKDGGVYETHMPDEAWVVEIPFFD